MGFIFMHLFIWKVKKKKKEEIFYLVASSATDMHYVYEQMINGKYIYPRELLYITKQTEALVSISCNSHKDREKTQWIS